MYNNMVREKNTFFPKFDLPLTAQTVNWHLLLGQFQTLIFQKLKNVFMKHETFSFAANQNTAYKAYCLVWYFPDERGKIFVIYSLGQDINKFQVFYSMD